MIELDGRQYTVKTASENTEDMRNTINTYCEAHDVRNSKGELIFIEARMSSPLYIILWALGYLATAIQNLIYSVGAAHNVQASSDTQLLNIAQMSNVKRGRASVTTIVVLVTAMTSDNPSYDAEAEVCTITGEDTVTINGVVYAPAVYPSLRIAPGDVKPVTLIAQTPGGYSIAARTINSFDAPVTNLDFLTQPNPSIPGQEVESIANLRARIQRRQISGTNIDSAMDAIRALPGVTLCNIFYNMQIISDPSQPGKIVGDDTDYVIVPPRWALLIVQGYSQDIAKTYFNFLTAQTIPWTTDIAGNITPSFENLSPKAKERILEVQIFTTHAHQKIPVLIMNPRIKPVYVKVYIGITIASKVELSLKQAVCTVALNLTAGQSVTSAQILDALQEFKAYSLQGVLVSSDEGVTYGYTTLQQDDLLWTFSIPNIRIEMPGAD